MENPRDIRILRDLAKEYAEMAHKDIQNDRRDLWRSHCSLRRTRPPILATYGMWNVWCREVFGDHAMECEDPFCRGHERVLRMRIFQDSVGDDSILEPWITQDAAVVMPPDGPWGLKVENIASGMEGGAWKLDPPLKEWEDVRKLVSPHHVIDEEPTARNVERLQEAVGDILEVNVERGPAYQSFYADISYHLAQLRGLEQIMIDMFEAPEQLHTLLAFMRDGILTVHQEAEDAGDWSLTSQGNQAMTYCDELEAPRANSGARMRKDLWCFCSAQEFTLISPAMHDEFMLQHQIPIIEKFGLSAYGCCEDLTNKIDVLRQVPNLRQIGVTPVADVARCAEQIGTDYVFSWRPNPTDMVCCGFDEDRIRRIIRAGMEAAKNCHVHIHLKDIETVEGNPERLSKWVRIVRSITDDYA